MEIDRRSLIKGMLAGGTLLALGSPAWAIADQPARRPERCVLLLGGTGADELFANGARVASADVAGQRLQAIRWEGGVPVGLDRFVKLLEEFRGLRLIAIMDDANAVIFLEQARPVGVRLLSMGTHACSMGNFCQLRHDWATISTDHGVGGMLASQLLQGQDSFSITESFLKEPPEGPTLRGWTAQGFASYRSGGSEAMHIHCSGLSLQDGCRVLCLEATEGWVSIPQNVCTCEAVTWRARNWVESAGYAITASALGVEQVRESCVSRAFVHQSRVEKRRQPMERFVSFVMDL
jgi:hypothetical protein